MSNFDQFFAGLPISLHERPAASHVGRPPFQPKMNMWCFVPVFPPGNAWQPNPNIGLGRFRLKQEVGETCGGRGD
jgi:hypothetical protein